MLQNDQEAGDYSRRDSQMVFDWSILRDIPTSLFQLQYIVLCIADHLSAQPLLPCDSLVLVPKVIWKHPDKNSFFANWNTDWAIPVQMPFSLATLLITTEMAWQSRSSALTLLFTPPYHGISLLSQRTWGWKAVGAIWSRFIRSYNNEMGISHLLIPIVGEFCPINE